MFHRGVEPHYSVSSGCFGLEQGQAGAYQAGWENADLCGHGRGTGFAMSVE